MNEFLSLVTMYMNKSYPYLTSIERFEQR